MVPDFLIIIGNHPNNVSNYAGKMKKQKILLNLSNVCFVLPIDSIN